MAADNPLTNLTNRFTQRSSNPNLDCNPPPEVGYVTRIGIQVKASCKRG